MIESLSAAWWVYILIGVGVGALGGMLGVGGGILMIPVLVMALSFPQKTAQGVSLAVMVPMALIGAVNYWRQGNLDVGLLVLLLLVAGALAGVMIGSELMHRIPGNVLRKIFAVFLLVIGVKMLLTTEQVRLTREPSNVEHTELNNEQK